MSNVTPKIQDLFTKWLSTQLTPAQMSELFITYYDIDEYLQNKKILSKSLLETYDLTTISSIKYIIMTDGKFRNAYRSKIEKFTKAINYYNRWISDNREKIENQLAAQKKENEGHVAVAKLEYEDNVTANMDLEVKSVEKILNDDEIREMESRKKQFSTWLSLKGKKQEMILVLLMELSKMNKLALSRGIIDNDLYFIENPLALKRISGRLQRCDDFMNLDRRLQKQYKNTLEYFIEFSVEKLHIKQDKDSINKEKAEGNCKRDLREEKRQLKIQYPIESVSLSEEEEQLSVILKENYENGFCINSAIDKGRIKVYYSEKFGKELSLVNEHLIMALKKVGTVRDDRIYAKQDREQTNLLNQIFDDVMNVFENGASCVYVEAVYQKYHIDLAEILQIYDAEVLGNQLVKMSEGEIRKKQTFLCFRNQQADLERDILRVLKQSPIPMTYYDIMEQMWYVPLDKIKHVLVITKSIVQVASETYFYSLNLPLNQDEVMEIVQLIRQALVYKSYITDVELRELIDENCPGISINTAEFTTYGLRNCLGYILKDIYSFNGPIISTLGKELSTAEVFAEYCADKVQITSEELKNFANDMKTMIYWDVVRDKMVRISEEVFWRNDQVEFDIDGIDDMLDTLCDKSYVPLKAIGLFMHFPPLNVQWNGYVLESFIYKYSKKYKLLHANFSASGFFGAMVKKNSRIDDYRSLIVDVLANSNQWTDKKSALELLVREGYQQRKRYGDIEKVLHDAKLMREKVNAAKK